ncbi:MAG: nickel-dependent hydrogenase large subunit [Candidatus Asgardarchaeia archaeon]
MTEKVVKERYTIPVGPQHPALKEPIFFKFIVDGEQIIEAIPRIGYVHRGIEKLTEERTYLKDAYLVERVCGICSGVHQVTFVNAVESLIDKPTPERADYLRVLVLELERIHSHYLWLGVAAHEIGFDTLFMYTWRDREVVMDLLELITGNRVNYGMNIIGGVRRDINDEIIHKTLKGIDYLEERAKYYLDVAANEKTILARTVGRGILTREQALKLGAVGPTARASNLAMDVRKDDPYLVYDEIPFELVTTDTNDVFGRIVVRVEELFESYNIIRWVLKNIPSGPTFIRTSPKVPAGEAIAKSEAPRGELFYYVRSTGTLKPYRVKIRTPTLANILAVAEMLKGEYIADIPIVFAGIDPCIACMDRAFFVDVEKDKKWFWSEDELKLYSRKWYKTHEKEVIQRWKR